MSQDLHGKNLLLSIYENELLTLVVAAKKWRPYLIGSTFIVHTNHHSLKYLLEYKVGTPTQQRWISKLLGYDFSIEFKSGHANRVIDALSRLDSEVLDGSLATISVPTPLWLQELKDAYL